MPTKKEWVVDEKGYHAKTVWETGRTSTYNPLEEEEAPQPAETDEVQLLEGTWHEGEDGFQFNKKCKVRVKAKFLKKTSRKKVTIDTYVEFDGELEDLGQQVEAFLNDDGIAETEVMLFYGDKYSNALQQNPDAKCRYNFKAKHCAAKKELESEKLEMPASHKANLIITLQINPDDEDSQDDTIRLFSAGNEQKYDTTLTVKEDKIPDDDCLTLEFSDLNKNLSYTLEINPGNKENIYYMFENKTLEEITNG